MLEFRDICFSLNSPVLEYVYEKLSNDGNYEPGNLRWADRKTQSRNRRSNTLDQEDVDKIRELAKTMTNIELSEMFNVGQQHISDIKHYRKWKI